jgi:type I restriction enzyme S subunit
MLNYNNDFEFQFLLAAKGVTQFGLSHSNIKNINIALPKITEQQQIANFLDTETKKIDDMIKIVKQAIAKLQEYRTSLITAAVTGKIDVREFKLPANKTEG